MYCSFCSSLNCCSASSVEFDKNVESTTLLGIQAYAGLMEKRLIMVEPGETFQETVIREVLEETGIEVEILSFAGVCINIERNIVNMDFICRYKKGDLKTSDESLELKWVKKEDVFEMVSNPLTKKRLKNMLSNSKDIYCFGFKKEPFSTVNDKYYSIGL